MINIKVRADWQHFAHQIVRIMVWFKPLFLRDRIIKQRSLSKHPPEFQVSS